MEETIKKKRGRKPNPNKKPKTPGELIISNAKTIRDPLINPFYIAMDLSCYTIFEEINPDGGTPYIKAVGYYTNFDTCLIKLAKLKTNTQSYKSIKEYIEEFKSMLNKIQNTIIL